MADEAFLDNEQRELAAATGEDAETSLLDATESLNANTNLEEAASLEESSA